MFATACLTVLVGCQAAVGTQDVPQDQHVVRIGFQRYFVGRLTPRCAFSHDALRVAVVAGPFGDIDIWNGVTGERLATAPVRRRTVTAIAYSSDGERMAACTDDGFVNLFEAVSGKPLRQLGPHRFQATAVAWSSDGAKLATSDGEGGVFLWEPGTGAAVGERRSSVTVKVLSFSPDGHWLAGGDREGALLLWELKEKGESSRWGAHREAVQSIDFSGDGSVLASAGEDGSLRTWDLKSRREVASLEGHHGLVFSVRFAPGSHVLAAAGADGTIRLWDGRLGTLLHSLKGHQDAVYAIGFREDGKKLGSLGSDRRIRLWDVKTGAQIPVHMGHLGSVESIAFAPDSTLLLSAGADSTVRLWDIRKAPVAVRTISHPGPVSGIAFQNTNTSWLTAGRDGILRRWTKETEDAAEVLSLKGNPLRAMVLDQAGLRIGAAGGASFVWSGDPQSGKESPSLSQPPAAVRAMTFSPDGRWIVGASERLLYCWSLRSGRIRATLETPGQVLAITLSGTGELIIAGDEEGVVTAWESASGTLAWQFNVNGERSPKGKTTVAVEALAASRDGGMVAVGCSDGRILFLELVRGAQVGEVAAHVGGVRCLAVSPREEMLASGGGEGTVSLWRFPAIGKRATKPLSAPNPHLLWEMLAKPTREGVRDAVDGFLLLGVSSVEYLKERVLPVARSGDLEKAFADLDDDNAAVRATAEARLRMFATTQDIERHSSRVGLTPEQVGRLRSVSEGIDIPTTRSAEVLRTLRVIRILGLLHTEEAISLLNRLAGGDPNAPETESARRTLMHLSRGK